MVYSNRSLEQDMYLDERREATRKSRDREAAEKIAQFFVETFGKGAIIGTCTDNRPNKIQLIKNFPGCLKVRHRGYEIFTDCSNVGDAKAQFTDWCKKEMPHARVTSPR